MKKVSIDQINQPLQRGWIRVVISYRKSGEQHCFQGIFNPDRNLGHLEKILRRRYKAKNNTLNQPQIISTDLYPPVYVPAEETRP